MKQLNDKTSELKKLSDYFKKIEKLAASLGIDVDEFMDVYKNDNDSVYHVFKDTVLEKAGQRASTFKNSKNDPSDGVPVGREII